MKRYVLRVGSKRYPMRDVIEAVLSVMSLSVMFFTVLCICLGVLRE